MARLWSAQPQNLTFASYLQPRDSRCINKWSEGSRSRLSEVSPGAPHHCHHYHHGGHHHYPHHYHHHGTTTMSHNMYPSGKGSSRDFRQMLHFSKAQTWLPEPIPVSPTSANTGRIIVPSWVNQKRAIKRCAETLSRDQKQRENRTLRRQRFTANRQWAEKRWLENWVPNTPMSPHLFLLHSSRHPRWLQMGFIFNRYQFHFSL